MNPTSERPYLRLVHDQAPVRMLDLQSAAGATAIRIGSVKPVKRLLTEFGVDRLSRLPRDRWADFRTRLAALAA